MESAVEKISQMEKNSMFYWYPIIRELDIPQPLTRMYKFNFEEFSTIQSEEGIPTSIYDNCLKFAEFVGFPLFMRTDNSSCKHGWESTCYVPDKESLKKHIYDLLEYSMMQGWMSYVDRGLAFREFLKLNTKFTAFSGNFPVNKERRYFIRDGKVECHHPYWYPPAIENPSISNWEKVLDDLNYETEAEIKRLTKYAEIVGRFFDGYWSVDFAMGSDAHWYMIDMAIGEDSFHWLECENCPDEMKKKYAKRCET